MGQPEKLIGKHNCMANKSGIILLALSLPLSGACSQNLDQVETAVSVAYATVHLPADSLHQALAGADSAAYVLFDVRQPEEYQLSRIGNAIQIDPDLSATDFANLHSQTVSGKKIVFYCSVGYRSSQLLQRVEEVALAAGAASLANLRGGIFRWYNQDLPIEASGDSVQVHPYNRQWGKLLKDK
jgi:rhodanese-related sulfurtransferase